MQDDKEKRENRTQPEVNDPRQARLKLALRENLKRRKSQAKGRSDMAVVPSDNAEVSPYRNNIRKPGK